MSWSLGEIQALTVKAARGAGRPWGVADEAGWAVRWLAAVGLPGVEVMAKVLTARSGPTCPLEIGMTCADTRDLRHAEGVMITHPLILLPFLGRLAGQDQTVLVEINGLNVHVAGDTTDAVGPLPEGTCLNLSLLPGTLPKRPRHFRIERISPDALTTLEDLAHRTYAPATEASRNSGAGAGLTDND